MGKTPENNAIIVSTAGLQTRSVLENPSHSFSDPRTYELLGDAGGGISDSGQAVTPKKFLSVAAIWQCVNMIARDIAKLPFDLFRRDGDQDRVKARDHKVFELIRNEPNAEMSAYVFWQLVVCQLKIWGNAYVFIERDNAGRPISLLPLLADRTAPKRVKGILYFVTEVGGKLEYADAADVIHLRGIGLDTVEGMAVLDAARETAGRALAAGNFASKFFRNGARVGGILTFPEGMSKQAMDRADSDFQKKIQDPKQALKTLVLRDGIKFQQLTIAPNEGQLTETREYEVKEAARFFNVPCSRLGVTGSVSYNSKSADDAAYLDSALMPDLIQISQECRRKLLTAKEKADGYYFEYNTRAIIYMDPLAQMQIAALGIRVGVMSPDEARAAMNMNKRPDGKGDEFVLQTNLSQAGYGQLGSADNTKIGNADPANPDAQRGGEIIPELRDLTEPTLSRAAVSLAFTLARQARHKAEKPHSLEQWTRTKWPQFDAEARAAGLPDGFCDEFRAKLASAYEANKEVPEKLSAAVDSIAAELEDQCLLAPA
jgi:HK97 family phage portal protein